MGENPNKTYSKTCTWVKMALNNWTTIKIGAKFELLDFQSCYFIITITLYYMTDVLDCMYIGFNLSKHIMK